MQLIDTKTHYKTRTLKDIAVTTKKLETVDLHLIEIMHAKDAFAVAYSVFPNHILSWSEMFAKTYRLKNFGSVIVAILQKSCTVKPLLSDHIKQDIFFGFSEWWLLIVS